MKDRSRLIALVLFVFAAALAGTWIGRNYIVSSPPAESDLHASLHAKLNLDQHQERKFEAIEAGFAVEKRALELELRADNAHLARAIQQEHGYGPKVRAAVDRSHAAMGELQKTTLEHIFAMRSVLRPDQARKFDDSVVKALTVPAK